MNEWRRNKWGSTPYNVFGVRYTTCGFLIWRVRERASVIVYLVRIVEELKSHTRTQSSLKKINIKTC